MLEFGVGNLSNQQVSTGGYSAKESKKVKNKTGIAISKLVFLEGKGEYLNAWNQFNERESNREGCFHLQVSVIPSLQRVGEVYRREIGLALSSSGFADWTAEQQAQVIGRCERIPIPLAKGTIRKVLFLLAKYQYSLCENRDIYYPARYEARSWKQYDGEKERYQEEVFDLEVHNSQKVILLLGENMTINVGRSKSVSKGIELSLAPKINAYSESLFNGDWKEGKVKNREEFCFKFYRDQSWIAEVNAIYSLKSTRLEDAVEERQIIEMKHYPKDLFDVLVKGVGNRKTRLNWCIQWMEGLECMHRNATVYRDLKPENILIEGNKAVLTDFGYSSFIADLKWMSVRLGSMPFVAPEILENKNFSFPLDIWSAGCTLWMVFGNGSLRLYPWHMYLKKDSPDKAAALKEMRKYDEQSIEDDVSISNLIRRMLRYDPEDRWTAKKVVEELRKIQASCT